MIRLLQILQKRTNHVCIKKLTQNRQRLLFPVTANRQFEGLNFGVQYEFYNDTRTGLRI